MIEIKLLQDAKPGHGGVLPAVKNTPEIAKIRHVPPGVTILSLPSHSTFSDAEGLLRFVQQLRELSGKPVGFKLCIGDTKEFENICEQNERPEYLSGFHYRRRCGSRNRRWATRILGWFTYAIETHIDFCK